MKTLYVALLAAWVSFALNFACAQTPGAKISGTVINNTSKPIDGATVILLAAKDSSVIKTELANSNGSFAFQNVNDNTYIIKVTYIGYTNYRSGAVVIANQQSVNLPAIVISSTTKTLKEVGVVEQKAYVEQKIDRTVINVNALISNAGANALEVLEKTPGVQVDENGNITFKGKTGVMVMIDDKPTYLSATSLAGYLRSLPASSLDQIELMDNPPAKYDAAGNAGVINIKTKKNTLKGFNATVSANFLQGFYKQTNEAINLNYRVNKINLFANISYAYDHTFRLLEIDRNFYDANANPTSIFKDFSYFRPSGNFTNFKTGLDFYASPNTTWGIMLKGTYNPDGDNSPVNSFIYNKNGGLDSTISTFNSSKNIFKSGGVNLNYSHKFDSTGKALTFDLDYIRDISGSDQTFINNTFLPNGSLQSSQTILENTPSYINIYAAKTDYSMPLKHKGKFEAGLKTSYVNTDNVANYYNVINGISTIDNNNTNRFLYKENINAAYVNYNKTIHRFALQTGLRLENTNSDGHQLGNAAKKDSAFTNHYTNLFPTAYFSYKLDTAGHNMLVFSYGRRIGRANYSSLNPFSFFVDKFSRFSGNPFLRPQFTDNYKLTYSYKSLISLAVAYNKTSDYQTETINQTGDIFVSTTGNIGERRNLDATATSTLQPAKWWTVNLYAEVYNNKFTGMVYSSQLNQSKTSYSTNVNNQFTLGKGWSTELSGNYNSSRVNGQFINIATGQVNAGLQKKVMNNKGTIRFNMRDIFRTFTPSGTINNIINSTAVAASTYHNTVDTQVATLGFTYNFSKAPNNLVRKRETGSADSEQGRVH